MKAIYLILLICYIHNNSLYSQHISIETSYYGKYLFTLKELHISCDSLVLNAMKNHLLSRDDESSPWHIPPERKEFALVSEETFVLIVQFIKENERLVSRINFPKPFKTIYYIDMFYPKQSKEEREKDKQYVNISFGKDITACKEYFQRLLNVIPDNSENEQIRFHLCQMIDNIEEGSKEHWENMPILDNVESYCPETIRKALEKIPDTEDYKNKRNYYEAILLRAKGNCEEENNRSRGWTDNSRNR